MLLLWLLHRCYGCESRLWRRSVDGEGLTGERLCFAGSSSGVKYALLLLWPCGQLGTLR